MLKFIAKGFLFLTLITFPAFTQTQNVISRYNETDKLIVNCSKSENPGVYCVLLFLNEAEESKEKKAYTEALHYLDQAISIHPDLDAYMEKGLMLLEHTNKSQEAIDCFQKVIAQHPKNFYAWYYSGIAYEKMKDFENAERVLVKALDIDPSSAVAHTYIGMIWCEMGRREEAMKAFNMAIQYDPNYVTSYLCRGFVNTIIGNYKGALDDYLNAKSLNPHRTAEINELIMNLFKIIDE
ncbi:MAG: tetratricopeptide repeat protein [Fibrobacteria bacterium]|nr:tetratricopeptide repeat protein [Fibrobacteria bacterium]